MLFLLKTILLKNNPFTSETYTSSWLKHYNNSENAIRFDDIKNVSFVKKKRLPIYTNVGKNLTKGIFYSLTQDKERLKLGNKVFLIYDVPEYFDISTADHIKDLSVHKVRQYQGFLANMETYDSIESYLEAKFSSKTRYKYRRNIKRLETCFNIEYAVHFGHIERAQYDFIFEVFHNLLTKRFSQKKENYDQLQHWEFYKDIVFDLINDKKASFFIIYSDQVPISIMLNLHSDDIIFDVIPVFDTDFSKFTIGHISILKIIEWCIASDTKTFDFSKGYYDYKERWGNKSYNFEYHILYNPKSVISSGLAFLLKKFFATKQYLREKNMNVLFHKILFMFGKKDKATSDATSLSVTKIETLPNDITAVNIHDLDQPDIRKKVNDYLFDSKENVNDISVYKNSSTPTLYYISGKAKALQIAIV